MLYTDPSTSSPPSRAPKCPNIGAFGTTSTMCSVSTRVRSKERQTQLSTPPPPSVDIARALLLLLLCHAADDMCSCARVYVLYPSAGAALQPVVAPAESAVSGLASERRDVARAAVESQPGSLPEEGPGGGYAISGDGNDAPGPRCSGRGSPQHRSEESWRCRQRKQRWR